MSRNDSHLSNRMQTLISQGANVFPLTIRSKRRSAPVLPGSFVFTVEAMGPLVLASILCVSASKLLFASDAVGSRSKNGSSCDTESVWASSKNGVECAHVFGQNVSSCLFDQLRLAGFTVFTHENLIGQNETFRDNRESCIFITTDANIGELRANFARRRFFRPFESIFLVSGGMNDEAHNLFSSSEIDNIYRSALNVYVVAKDSLINVLTGRALVLPADGQQLLNFYGDILQHPFLNTSDPSKQFTISLFNYSPFVIFFLDEAGQRFSLLERSMEMTFILIRFCSAAMASMESSTGSSVK